MPWIDVLKLALLLISHSHMSWSTAYWYVLFCTNPHNFRFKNKAKQKQCRTAHIFTHAFSKHSKHKKSPVKRRIAQHLS